MNTPDIIFLICNSLNDIDKFAFLSITTAHNKLKDKMWFTDRVYFYRIHGHKYYDRFTNLIICPMTKNCVEIIDDKVIALRKIRLPNGIKRLECNYDIKFHEIPEGLTHFNNRYDSSCLPTSITHLELDRLNKTISMQLLTDHPKRLSNLKFVKINNFYFGDINEGNYRGFPKTVTHLICFSYIFSNDQMILVQNSVAQSNLEHLYFRMIPLTTCQPPSLTIATLYHKDAYLYSHLKKLYLKRFRFDISLYHLVNLEILKIYHSIGDIVSDYLPPNLKYLRLGIFEKETSKIRGLPNTLERLSLREIGYFDCITLPHLIYIKFGYRFCELVIENIISPKLLYLKIDDEYALQNIPSTVRHLLIGNNFNKTIRKKIPSFITHLTFGNEFNKSVRCNIPPSVTHLTLGKKFYQKKLGNVLPKTITHLTLSSKCYSLNKDNLRNRNLSITIQHVHEKNPFKE